MKLLVLFSVTFLSLTSYAISKSKICISQDGVEEKIWEELKESDIANFISSKDYTFNIDSEFNIKDQAYIYRGYGKGNFHDCMSYFGYSCATGVDLYIEASCDGHLIKTQAAVVEDPL